MSFVKKIIGPDETLIGISSAHWIYGAKGLLWLAAMMGVGLALDYYVSGMFDYLFQNNGAFASNRIGDVLFWIPTALGAVMFLLYLLQMIAPEIALTNKRIIYKKGIIAVDVKELDLEEIKAVDVDNGTFGRFLNYGFIVFDARFVGNMDLPAIAKPYRFVKALNEARGSAKEGNSLSDVAASPQPEKQAHQHGNAPQSPPPVELAQSPQLTDPRYSDPSDSTPARAVNQVINEMSENTRRALNPDLPPETKSRPLIFKSQLLTRAKNLRQKIKDSFSDKAA